MLHKHSVVSLFVSLFASVASVCDSNSHLQRVVLVHWSSAWTENRPDTKTLATTCVPFHLLKWMPTRSTCSVGTIRLMCAGVA